MKSKGTEKGLDERWKMKRPFEETRWKSGRGRKPGN